MTEERILIPEKLYVGLPKEKWGKPVPSAYLTAWGKDSGSKGRMNNVDKYSDHTITLDNEPIYGFEIGGNTGKDEWRVNDPRGFAAIISAHNFYQLLNTCTVVNGVVVEPCVWARSNGNNVLLNTQSDVYSLSLQATQVSNSRETWRAVKPGYRITLNNGFQGVYLGKFHGLENHILRVNSQTNFVASENKNFVIVKDQNIKHWIRTITHEIHWLSSPKLARIDQQDEIPLADAELYLNNLLQDASSMQTAYNNYFFASASGFDTMPTLNVEPHEQGNDLVACDQSPHRSFVELTDGQLGVLENHRHPRPSFNLNLINAHLFLTQGTVEYLSTPSRTFHKTINTCSVDQNQVKAIYQLKATWQTALKNDISRLV